MDIGIVGGGLFGRIIAAHLTSLGHLITLYDPGYAESGLAAAGCLMKPSWMSGVPRREESLEMLDRHFGVEAVPFKVVNKYVSVGDCWVLNKQNLLEQTLGARWVGEAASGTSPNGEVALEGSTGEHDFVIETIGSWSRPENTRWGVSFQWYCSRGIPSTIKPWRPFTQLVKFRMPGSGDVWAGDGTAVKDLTPQKLAECQERVERFVLLGPPQLTIRGRRPYPSSKLPKDMPCELELGAKTARVNGGGKNGTIAAAWAALEIGDYLAGD